MIMILTVIMVMITVKMMILNFVPFCDHDKDLVWSKCFRSMNRVSPRRTQFLSRFSLSSYLPTRSRSRFLSFCLFMVMIVMLCDLKMYRFMNRISPRKTQFPSCSWQSSYLPTTGCTCMSRSRFWSMCLFGDQDTDNDLVWSKCFRFMNRVSPRKTHLYIYYYYFHYLNVSGPRAEYPQGGPSSLPVPSKVLSRGGL